MSEAILGVRGLTMEFGGIRALDKVDLQIRPGEIVALIGPNGAGKTTFFNCLTGIYTPTAGELVLTGRDRHRREWSALAPHLPHARHWPLADAVRASGCRRLG